MPVVGKPPYRRGSKKTTDMSVGILNGKPSIQVNWGGRIYGAPLSLLGSGSVKDSLEVSDIRATGNITFARNSAVHNNSNRVLMVGGLVTSGDENMAIGDTDTMSSLLPTTSGSTSLYNLAVGMDTGSNITTGASNVCLGFRAGKAVTTGSSNVMLGTSAGNTSNDAVITGSLNVFIGHTAGQPSTGTASGSGNILIGYQSGIAMGAICDAVGIGNRALATTSGERNIGIGKNAGDSAGISGDDNICIGYQTGNTITTGSDNICIGYDTDVSASGAVGQVVISPIAATCTGDNTTLIANTNIILDAADDIILDIGGSDEVLFKEAGSTFAKIWETSGAYFRLYESAGGTDSFTIYTYSGGQTSIGTTDAAGHSGDLLFDADGELNLQCYGSGVAIAESAAEDITIKPGGTVKIVKTRTHTTAATMSALYVDLDRTGTVSTGTDSVTGILVDVLHTGASGGTINSIGMSTTVVGDSGGTSTADGITIDVSGADTCNGIYIDNKNGGTDFKNVSSADATDYFTINTIAAGATTLTTVDTTVGATGHLNMVADGNFTVDAEGDISLDAQGGNITLLDGGSTYTPSASSDAVTLSHLPFVLYSQFQDDVTTGKHYLPLKGYFEQTAVGNEPTGMIAPFNMKLQKIVMRCSEDISGATFTLGMWAIASGTTHAHHHTIGGRNWTTVTGGAADTNAIFDFTGTLGLNSDSTGGSNGIDAGEWLDFQIYAGSDPGITTSAEWWFTLFFIADLASTI